MKMLKAMAEVKSGTIDNVRGVGCATITMVDGREFGVVDQHETLVERFTDAGELIERVEASDVAGDADSIRWSVDELGGVYC